MEETKKKKGLLYVRRILLLLLFYVVISLVVPPLFHKSVTEKTSGRDAEGTAQERILSIDNNMDALLWRLRLIEQAQESIVLVTFDFRDDNSGRDIMAALLHAADRGVQVRVIVDGINGALRLSGSENFRELASHERVEVKLYNPVNPVKLWETNYRMHDKYLIADDFAYILGGRNTDDLFLGNYAKSYNEDRDILVYETEPGKGGSYQQLWEYFERIWTLPCCELFEREGDTGGYLDKHYQELKEKYPAAFATPDWEEAAIEPESIELCTNPIEPENKEPVLWGRMVEEMERKDDVLIQTPYIICSKEMYQDLTGLNADHPKVEVMINAVEKGSNPFGCTDYLNEKKNVQKTGSSIYEYLGDQALHTKTILAGKNISIVGSCNLDMRSIYLDTEMMLIIDSPELNEMLRSQIEELAKKSRKVLPGGAVIDGADYKAAKPDAKKKIFYGILRVVIIPFRHLL